VTELPPERDTAVVDSQSLRERRDVQRAIEHWLRNTWGKGCAPFLDTFDFSPMKGDWGHRFLVCGGEKAASAVFVIYGADFARLHGLPHKAAPEIPFVEQIPERYRAIFSEGYGKAIAESAPVTLKGAISGAAGIELYRAAFMPIILQPNWSKQLVFGSFNCRSLSGASS
jgi:hypothetical protein